MNLICKQPSMKKQKIIGELEEDRISQLPDSLLHCILSLLPTKEAVATSVLSKRWTDLWTSVTNLDFLCPDHYITKVNGRLVYVTANEQNHRSLHFVERVLLLHSANIRKFRLQSSNHLTSSRVISWISAAVRRRVQELHLATHMESVLILPRCLCTSEILTVLKVERMHCLIQFPSIIFFSSLKTLYLTHVEFVDDISLNRLFSGLPILEELKLHRCKWGNIRNVTISIPSLRSLTFYVACNKSSFECEIKVYAANLVYLNCSSDLSINLLLNNLSSLVDAYIDMKTLWNHPKATQFAANIINGLRCAKTLKISEGTLEGLYRIYGNLEETVNVFPTFSYLTSLEVNTMVTNRISRVLMGIFRGSPVLESIVIDEVYKGTWMTNPQPHGLKFCLKTCCLLEFRGRPAEMRFVKFLLKVATVLETIKIYCSEGLTKDEKKQEEVTKELGRVPKRSSRCGIQLLKYTDREIKRKY
ncbi:F-box/LRR-repeat protein At4g14103-like [Tripterygium wilfordii]|uniref:F-box/LRR-repeat protein At4g14103-like n=1 Tax=Tripterygium wilfordii TaxID=458696 RepID=UPI0018F7F64D|nr:F-box/LRR-repeat protein At4g14103-like [Tripterygium wilfordii]XP_038689463.1 F-box/LRR-repeat protein At4g14103-like [Tripterygium wilfordii]